MKLKIEKIESDYYRIIRVRHTNKRWEFPVKCGDMNGVQIMYSRRPSPEADVEGDRYDMQQIVEAINNKGKYISKRCEIEYKYNSFILGSPKNSWTPIILSIEDANYLKINITKYLTKKV